MAQVSGRTRLIRLLLILILFVSLAVGAHALWEMFFALQQPPPPPASSATPDAMENIPVLGNSAQATGVEGYTALIISTITSITSVIALVMSKYTEWQRARLEQKTLAIELEKKELELQEMRRKLQNT